jgi:hypothetical protein
MIPACFFDCPQAAIRPAFSAEQKTALLRCLRNPEEAGRWESRETVWFCKKIFTFGEGNFSRDPTIVPTAQWHGAGIP